MEGRIIKTPLGRILLGRLLGQGSFGVVHEATMLKPDKYGHRQRYAVKCMSQFPAGSSMAALQDEEMYLHHMVSEHPNVVDIHGTVVDAREHLVFIVLELCTGGTLHERICDGVFLRGSDGADEKIKSVFGQLLDAVEHCHLKGVYHRDLKPGNVLIEGEGRAAQALLTDFGMASMQKRGTSLRYGTRQFWSPECQGDLGPTRYSLQTNDIWSLGIILVLMITGRFPWSLASPSDRCFEAYQRVPETIRMALGISPEAWELLQKVLCVNVTDRITVKALREELDKIGTFSVEMKGDMPAEEEDETNVEGQTAVSSSDQDVFSSLILGVSESASASVDPTMAEEYKQGRAVSLSSPPEVSKSVSRSRQMGCTARRLLYIPRLLKTKGRRVLGMESGPVPPAMARSPARPQFIASFY
ncbi:kinase-like domain-containing protein [Pterulicium gracile]|uniref:Kinase-like domain-containing protein n=1 Tax=Pterulicium gracile TaxID=1884261 RepID=A0A5C3QYH7_9AGAR|nr:kinase-like domain-containing protein [Pterula gracilis]